MILNKNNQILTIGDNEFSIGCNYIVRNDLGDILYPENYGGKFAEIIEIRTGEDMDTDNIGPDIYVRVDDDEIIVAPDMLERVPF